MGHSSNGAGHPPGFEAFTAAATAAHARRPDAVYQIVRDRLAVNAAGEITNLADVIDQARREVPELFGITGNGNAGAQGGSSPVNPNTAMNQEIRRATGRDAGPF